MQTQIILFNIRSAHNVGSIFRTADGAGVEKIYLVGLTPTPTDRFGRVQPEIQKTSLGASATVPWEHVGKADDVSLVATLGLIAELHDSGFAVVAVEQTPEAISLYDFIPPPKVVYIFGHEVEGVPAEIIAAVNQVVEIPLQGQKESLNVSVSAGVVLFHR